MKKVFIVVAVCFGLVASLVSAFVQERVKIWAEAKPICEKAVSIMIRTSVVGWPEDYFGQVKTLSEKEEIIRLWLLAVDGSYSDCIIPGLGMYMRLYDDAIKVAKTDTERRLLFISEINGLIKIFETLDLQIKTFVDFKGQAIRDFNSFLKKKLGRKSKDADKTDEVWEKFLKTNPKYAGTWPGFFSTQVGWQKGSRSYNRYHLSEIQQLRKLSIPVSLSVKRYDLLLKSLTGRLSSAQNYM